MGLHDSLMDYVFPKLAWPNAQVTKGYKDRRSKVRDERETLVSNLSSNEELLKEYLQSVDKLVEQEQSRRTSVDARLMSIVGLTSIAATVVLTALFAMAAGTMPLPQGVAKWILVIGCLYLALQLYAALSAAVKGLSSAAYDHETASDLIPSALARAVFLRRRISNKFDLLEQHQEVNNGKVSQMKVAHCAVSNFLFALLILAGAASLMALNRESPKDASVCGDAARSCSGHQASPSKTIKLTKILTIGPFPDGNHLLDQERVLSCARETLKPYGNIQFGGWQIVGRVDKRQLNADHAAVYGSNQALAMARAVWVTDNVLSHFSTFESASAVISIGGAQNVGSAVGDSDLKLDRAVDIYVLLDQELLKTTTVKQYTTTCPKEK